MLCSGNCRCWFNLLVIVLNVCVNMGNLLYNLWFILMCCVFCLGNMIIVLFIDFGWLIVMLVFGLFVVSLVSLVISCLWFVLIIIVWCLNIEWLVNEYFILIGFSFGLVCMWVISWFVCVVNVLVDFVEIIYGIIDGCGFLVFLFVLIGVFVGVGMGVFFKIRCVLVLLILKEDIVVWCGCLLIDYFLVLVNIDIVLLV